MTKALCFNCGDIKFGALCQCENCKSEATGNTMLDIAFTDHNYSVKTLRSFGKIIKNINSQCEDPEIRFWAFIYYILRYYPTILDAEIPDKVRNNVESIINKLPLAQFTVQSLHTSQTRLPLTKQKANHDEKSQGIFNVKKMEYKKIFLKNIFRWIAVFPGSLLGMILTYGLSCGIHNLTAARYIDIHSWWNILFTDITSNMMAGAAFIFIGYKIAPTHKKITAIVLTALMLLVGGASLFIANFLTEQYYYNIGITAGIIGSIICCVCISKGDFENK